MDNSKSLPSSGRLPGARSALTLLLLINMFNYIDRQILSAVQPKIEAEFGRSQAEVGLLASMFLISYTIISPLFGWLGDRMSRWWLVAIGVVVWSVASGGTGLAATFGMLLLTRALIGVGEGAYGPVAPTLIADMYPVEQRGAKLAWFYVAIPVGSALGYVIGGLFADHLGGPTAAWWARNVGFPPEACKPEQSWRWAFFAVVLPGVILGLVCLFMREPQRGQADAMTSRTARLKDYRTLIRIPSYVLNTLGMTAMTFSLGAVAVWIPTYLYEREATYVITHTTFEKLREHQDPVPDPIVEWLKPVGRLLGVKGPPPAMTEGMLAKLRPLAGQSFQGMDALRRGLSECLTTDERLQYRARIGEAAWDKERSVELGRVSVIFGVIVVASGLGATLFGGWLGDRLRPRWPGSYFLVSGFGMLIAVPLFLLAVETPLPWGWAFIFVAVFFLFVNTGPSNTILANVAHPAMRSTAFALNILVIHVLGDVISPPIVGWLGDHYGLRMGLRVLSVMILAAGVFWLWGAKYLAKDTELAPTRLRN